MKNTTPIETKKKPQISNLEGKGGGRVRALERGLHIIKCFDVEHPSWSIADLGRAVGLHSATTRRLVKTLQSESILTMDPDSGQYRLGAALLPLTYLARSQDQLVRVAQPILERIAARTGETVGLAIWTDRGVLLVYGITTPRFFKPVLTPGQVSTQYGSTHSKIFLAFGPEERLSKLTLGERGPTMTLAELADLREELNKIRETGIAYDIEERSKEVCAVGVPVRDAVGEVVASIAVIVPKERFGAAQKDMISSYIKEAGDALSRELGFRGYGERSIQKATQGWSAVAQ